MREYEKRWYKMKKIKALALVLVMLLCIMSAVPAFAENEDEPLYGAVDETDYSEYEDTVPSSDAEPTSDYQEPTDDYTEPTQDYSEDPVEYTDPDDDPYYTEPEPSYYPQPEDYAYDPEVDQIASNITETISVTGSIDTKTLTDSDWEQIRLALQSGSAEDDGDNFNFIKNNTDKSNNGAWIPIVGVLLLICAAACLVFFIFETKKASAYKKAAASGRRTKPLDNDDYGDSYSNRPSKKRSGTKKSSSYDGRHSR